jgi:hypothetical protein
MRPEALTNMDMLTGAICKISVANKYCENVIVFEASRSVTIARYPGTQLFRNPLWFPALSLVLYDAESPLEHPRTCAWQQIIASHSA